MPKPHGGKLVNRILKGKNIEKTTANSQKVEISKTIATDTENIAKGTFSPLQGFMNQEELENVLNHKRLPNDLPWTIPIVLDVPEEKAKNLSKGLGFSKEDRDTHNKRVIYVCRLLTRNGVNTVVSLISPYRSTRAYAREQLPKFVEVYLKCSLEECMRRDPKGLYKKALAGEITNMTGIQDPYEEPLDPEVMLNTESDPPHKNIRRVVQKLQDLGYLARAQ